MIFGAGSTVSPGAPVKAADLARLIQEVIAGINLLGGAPQTAGETACRVSSQNDARRQEMQARMSAIEGGSVVSGGPASTVSSGAQRDRRLFDARHALARTNKQMTCSPRRCGGLAASRRRGSEMLGRAACNGHARSFAPQWASIGGGGGGDKPEAIRHSLRHSSPPHQKLRFR